MRSRRVLRIAIWAAAAVVALGVLYVSVTFVQVWSASHRDQQLDADAIVVLGAAQYNGRPSPVFQARLDHAVELYEDGRAELVVVTGGSQTGDRFTEGYSGFSYLLEQGVPEEAVVLEDQGTNTWEQLAAAARILEDRGADQVILVSDPYHTYRLAATAEELGLDPSVSPAQTGTSLSRLAKETAAVSLGRLVGFGRLERIEDRRG